MDGSRSFRISCILLSLLFILLTIQSGKAGLYHASGDETITGEETLACSQCHTMHGTQGGQSLIYGGTAAVYPKLLRASSILNLCLYCHQDNSVGMTNPTPPDIWNNTLGYIPSGGDFAHLNYTNESNRHSVGTDVSIITPPGSDTTVDWTAVTTRYGIIFNCLYCHDQHGNRNYRNLRYDPGNPTNDTEAAGVKVSYSLDGGVCSTGELAPCDIDNTTDVNDSLFKYNRNSVKFYKPGATDYNRLAQWCGRCHANFFGQSGDTNLGGTPAVGVGAGDDNTGSPWVRHPVGDINMTIAGGNLHVDTATWLDTAMTGRPRYVEPDSYGTETIDGNEQPFCLSCHYAHGGGNPNNATDPTLDHSNLVYVDAGGNLNMDTTYDTATGMLRNTCQKCHNQ